VVVKTAFLTKHCLMVIQMAVSMGVLAPALGGRRRLRPPLGRCAPFVGVPVCQSACSQARLKQGVAIGCCHAGASGGLQRICGKGTVAQKKRLFDVLTCGLHGQSKVIKRANADRMNIVKAYNCLVDVLNTGNYWVRIVFATRIVLSMKLRIRHLKPGELPPQHPAPRRDVLFDFFMPSLVGRGRRRRGVETAGASSQFRRFREKDVKFREECRLLLNGDVQDPVHVTHWCSGVRGPCGCQSKEDTLDRVVKLAVQFCLGRRPRRGELDEFTSVSQLSRYFGFLMNLGNAMRDIREFFSSTGRKRLPKFCNACSGRAPCERPCPRHAICKILLFFLSTVALQLLVGVFDKDFAPRPPWATHVPRGVHFLRGVRPTGNFGRRPVRK